MRRDDNPEVFEERLREYYKKTAPLIGYYYAKGMLKSVDGMADMDTVTTDRGDTRTGPNAKQVLTVRCRGCARQ